MQQKIIIDVVRELLVDGDVELHNGEIVLKYEAPHFTVDYSSKKVSFDDLETTFPRFYLASPVQQNVSRNRLTPSQKEEVEQMIMSALATGSV